MSSADDFNRYIPQKQEELTRRFQELFKGNERGYGFGEGKGAYFNDEKNKGEYHPGSIGWKWGKPGVIQFHEHLSGKVALGIGPLLEDGTTMRGEIDVDKIGHDTRYDFDYSIEMGKISQSGLPTIVCRTKSAGLRVIVFFTEPIDADTVRKGMANVAATLGYAGNEIFPKQSKLIKEDDAPSWTFLPYGSTFGEIFADQCGMSESGNALLLEDFLNLAESRRISREEFLRIAFENQKAGGGHAHGANGSNRARRPKGIWAEEDSYFNTLKETFKGGPPCLFYIANGKSTQYQHNYLFNAAIFVKKKYPDNWDQTLGWINFNVLKPPGDSEKLQALIKDFRHRDYEYRCKDEPICGHCMADACRRMPFGVGNGRAGIDHYELGITKINRIPAIYYVNVADARMPMTSEELMNMKLYRVKSMGYTGHFPDMLKQQEWDQIVRRGLENATVIEPTELLRTDASEIESLESYFSIHVPSAMRAGGQEYLDGKVGEYVRLKESEGRFYFKWKGLNNYCVRGLGKRDREVDRMRLFLDKVGEFHGRTDGRDWYRSTYSVPVALFDETVVYVWLHQDGE